MKQIFRKQNLAAISSQVSHASLLPQSCGAQIRNDKKLDWEKENK
jgi:hypothetical protein